MKLFYVLVFMLITHSSYAQVKYEKIYSDIEELNEGLINDVYKYEESTNTLNYQIYFLDEESFNLYTHFKSVEDILQDTFNKLKSTGVLKKVNDLGVVDVKLLIKSETTGDILVSKLLNLGVAKASTLKSLESGS